jgi:hypothetical protein
MIVSPRSLENLKPKFGESKTDTGWQHFIALAGELGLSLSDFIEKVARKELVLANASEKDIEQKHIC